MQGGNAALRVKSLELRVKIWYVRLRGHIFIEWDEKAFSLGEKPYRYPQNRGRGMPRPYRAMICIAQLGGVSPPRRGKG